ncbi:hypothetical protein F2P81_009514 [Scophthalmus maximus]|uniref:Uncharacterized protein n=1 Tax=Scophthalmus maximus TaxID=52904 RepID=A0A6A4T4X0_SCOMX|nr:hypothetical protein F2P81_009514 [Scophthalmus maximus]
MRKKLLKSYAVKVPDNDLNRNDGKVWYIPHHEEIAWPIRLWRFISGSLTSLISTLIGVLTKFCQEAVAIMADVEAMFHQIKVPPEYPDLLRFLWWPDGDINSDLVEYRMVVNLFGATSSLSCASCALRRCAEDNRDLFDAAVVDTVLHKFYVDDCLKSVSSEVEAVQLYNLKAMRQQGGFNLMKWISNSRVVPAAIPQVEKANDVKDLDLDQDSLPMERALGVQWCVQFDRFKFRLVIQDKLPT